MIAVTCEGGEKAMARLARFCAEQAAGFSEGYARCVTKESRSADNMLSPDQSILGLDIGGSKTRGVLWKQGDILADRSVGSANVQNVSVDEATQHLTALFAAFPPIPIGQVVAGAGGIDTPADAAALRSLIRAHCPHAQITVVHDTRLLLAAAGLDAGIVVIAGTGSAAWGVDSRGREARAGGWGFRLGDEGSGYWMVREALRRGLLAMDCGQQPDALTQAMMASRDLESARAFIAAFHTAPSRAAWAALAPRIFALAEHGDLASRGLVDQAAQELVALAVRVARRLAIPGPVILGSGLGTHQPLLQQAFREHLAQHGYTSCRILDQDPVFGALYLASHEDKRLRPTDDD